MSDYATYIVVAVHVRGGVVAEVRAFSDEAPALAWERTLALGTGEYEGNGYGLTEQPDGGFDWSDSDGSFAIERVVVE